MEKLFIISNESIFENEGKYFCDNLDMKSTPEGLKNKFDINIIARRSKKIRAHKIGTSKIKIFSSIYSYLLMIFNSAKNNNSKFLIISITPYTFLACVLLKIFKKKTYCLFEK